MIAIGRINSKTLSLLSGLGIDGAAVVSAIMGSEDAKGTAEELKNKFILIFIPPTAFGCE